MPLTADYLLGHIRKLPDKSYIVGGQEVSISGVDITTGEVSQILEYLKEFIISNQHIIISNC